MLRRLYSNKYLLYGVIIVCAILLLYFKVTAPDNSGMTFNELAIKDFSKHINTSLADLMAEYKNTTLNKTIK
jgi:hypothetical protein